jgi:hypothetical protein
MAGTLNGLAEPDDSNQVPGNLNVVVTVPEEFVGLSIQELNARGAGSLKLKVGAKTS